MTNSTSAIIRAMNKNKEGLRTEESHAGMRFLQK